MSHSYSSYQTEGSSALKPTYERFTVIEGGRRVSPRTHARSERAPQGNNTLLVVVATLCVLAALFAGSLFVNARVNANRAAALEEIEAQTVTVQAGDSLWGLAEAHPVEGYSTSELVTWMLEKNGLDTATLQPGQDLLVPVSA